MKMPVMVQCVICHTQYMFKYNSCQHLPFPSGSPPAPKPVLTEEGTHTVEVPAAQRRPQHNLCIFYSLGTDTINFFLNSEA